MLLQVAAAGAVGVQLLISRELLSALDASRWRGARLAISTRGSPRSPGLTALLGVLSAVTAYEQKLLVELSSRHAFDRIIDVSAAVDLEAFEEPDFFDQLQRARNSGLYRLMDMVTSVMLLITGLLTAVGDRRRALPAPAGTARLRRACRGSFRSWQRSATAASRTHSSTQ